MKKTRNLILILMVLLCFNGCEKNQLEEKTPSKNDELTIEQAKAFVDVQRMNGFALKSGDLKKQSINIKADWKKSKGSSNEDVSVIETEIQAMGGFGFATSESMDAWTSTKNDKYLFSMSRLVVFKQKKTGEMFSFIMSIVADKPYFESKNFKIGDNTYLKRDKDFSGYVIFHKLTGEFVNGWVYCDGQIIHSMAQAQNLDLQVNLKSANFIVPIYHWEIESTDWYNIGSVDGNVISVSYSNTTYRSVYVVVGYYDTGGETITIVGGASGGYIPPPTTIPCNCLETCPICGKCLQVLKSAPVDGDNPTAATMVCKMCTCPSLQSQLKSLFPNGTTNLSPEDITNLNETFSHMNLDCMFNAITNYLTNNNIQLGSVSIDESMNFGNASISNLGNLKFAGSWAITSNNLSHEWFHLGQRKMNTISSSSDGYAEFEDWLFFDIKETIRVGANFEASSHEFACYKSWVGVGVDQPYKEDYRNWLRSITNDGTTFPTANTMGFYNFGPKFAETRGYTYMSFSNTSYNPKTMFDLFNKCK